MNDHKTFELRRQSDELVYTFDLNVKDGVSAYKRRDADLWITYRKKFGWCAWDDDTSSLMGRSWETLPPDQLAFPPAGIWVSRKNDKSYVYELVYI